MKIKFWIFLVIALLFGIMIAYVDTRPNWDDTGITAGAIFLSAMLFSVFNSKRAWIWALAIGVWVPLLNIYYTNNYGSLIALIIAFVGAYAWFFITKIFQR
jgi:hypothetical protein